MFTKYSTSCHLELQQRACEYLALPNISADTMEAVLNPMPPFEAKESSLLSLTSGSSHNGGANADKVATTVAGSAAGDADDKKAVKEVQKVSDTELDHHIAFN